MAGQTLRASMTELELQAAVTDLLDLFGWMWQHQRPARTQHGWTTAVEGWVGFPDLIAVRGTRMLAIELKSAKGRVSAAQQAWLTALAETGVETFVWRPRDLDDIPRIVGKDRQ